MTLIRVGRVEEPQSDWRRAVAAVSERRVAQGRALYTERSAAELYRGARSSERERYARQASRLGAQRPSTGPCSVSHHKVDRNPNRMGVPGRSCLKTGVVRSGQVMRMRPICCAVAFLVLLAGTAVARVGDPLSGFSTGALMQQLQLTPSSQTADAAGRQIYRYVSDDEAITVDVVARGGLIEQQLLSVPLDPR